MLGRVLHAATCSRTIAVNGARTAEIGRRGFAAGNRGLLGKTATSIFMVASSLIGGLCFAAGASAQGAAGSDPLLKIAPITPERVAPLKEHPLPAVPPVEGKATYLQYSDMGDHDQCAPILVTRLPNPHKRLPSGPVPTWQLALLAHYDADTKTVQPPGGGRDSNSCPGGCPGSMNLMIHNSFSALLRLPQAVYRRIKRDQQWAVVRQGDCLFAESEFGFKYKVSKYRGVKCDDPGKRYQSDDMFAKEYFYDAESSSDAAFIYECDPNMPYPHCTGYVSVPGSAGIDFKFTFRRQELPQWRDIQAAATAYVSRLIEGVVPPPGCLADGRH